MLERADGMVAHGGWGSLTASASAGVPVEVVKLGADHDTNAATVERVGFGISVDPVDLDQARAGEAAHRLFTDDDLRAAAAAQRDIISQMPSPSATVSTLTVRHGSTKTH